MGDLLATAVDLGALLSTMARFQKIPHNKDNQLMEAARFSQHGNAWHTMPMCCGCARAAPDMAYELNPQLWASLRPHRAVQTLHCSFEASNTEWERRGEEGGFKSLGGRCGERCAPGG